MVRNYEKVLELIEKSIKIFRVTNSILIGWKPLETGWRKLNVDGSVLQTSNSGLCDGILRDSNGLIMAGFMMNIEKVEINSTCAVNLLQHASTDLHDSTSLICAIKELQANSGDFRVNHVLKEVNFSANVLAKHALNLPGSLNGFVSPPPFWCQPLKLIGDRWCLLEL
ncbi:hypothetical protein AHAS_Ahas19G0065700 [Arachis hypogaea]